MSSNQQIDHLTDSNDERDEEENPTENQLQGGKLSLEPIPLSALSTKPL